MRVVLLTVAVVAALCAASTDALSLRHFAAGARSGRKVQAHQILARCAPQGHDVSCGSDGLKCPHSGGVCCRGGQHCCPHGYKCGRTDGSECPFCVKADHNLCPGTARKGATGLHQHANKRCGRGADASKSVTSCRSFWLHDKSGCPSGTVPRSGVLQSPCSGAKCADTCCMDSDAAYSCGNFYFENGCRKAGKDALTTPKLKCDKAGGGCLKCCEGHAQGKQAGKNTIERPTVEERREKVEEKPQPTKPKKEEEPADKEEEEPADKEEEEPADKEEERPDKEEGEGRTTCSAWWQQNKGCPDNRVKIAASTALKCEKDQCMKQCCQVPKPVVFTCDAFLDENECPSGKVQDMNNKDNECDKATCLTRCCKSPPKTTCNAFWGENPCPPKTSKIESNAKQHCDGRNCISLCCKDIPRCQDWLDEGRKCDDGTEVDPTKRDALVGDSMDKFKDVCCRRIPPKPIPCESFWGASRCPADTVPNEAHKAVRCVKDECRQKCCHKPPPTCDNWLDAHECPTEWMEVPANKNKVCRGQACNTVCCKKLPPTCTRWWEKHQCVAPLIHNKGQAQVRCTAKNCPKTCCKKPPPHFCSHWWARNECPRTRPRSNKANTKKECKGNQCLQTCCLPPPPPPPTCQLAWWKEHCEARKLLRRNEHAFHKCHGDQCTAVCCKKPPAFRSTHRRCYWTGDPHWGSWDGSRFDMYNTGEWVMYKDSYDNEQINSLTAKFHRNPRPSYTTGVAMRSGKDVIAMNLKDMAQNWNPQLFVNGKAMPWKRGAKYRAGQRLTVEVLWQNGMSVHGTLFKIYSNSKAGPMTWCTGWSRARYWSFLNCYATIKGWYEPARTLGFCGRADGNGANDFNLPDGTLMASNGAHRQANANKMANAWRVPGKDSMFTLREGHFQQTRGGDQNGKLTPLKAANGNTALVARAFGQCHKVAVAAQQQCMIDYIEGMKQEAVKDAIKAEGQRPVQQQ